MSVRNFPLVCGIVSIVCFLQAANGVIIDLEDLPPEPLQRVCYGTHNGLSYSGSLRQHYQRMRRRYTGCTHVAGNLELTHLDSSNIDYDLSFLQHIRYVSGYVLIALVTRVQHIPLHNLEIIRGNFTYSSHNGPSDCSLAVLMNYPYRNPSAGLKEIQMPSLKEITNGKVLFVRNPSLGFVDTIDWNGLARHRPNTLVTRNNGYNETVSNAVDRSNCPSGRMWGRNYCQAAMPDFNCGSTFCDDLCYGDGSFQCCHDSCAAGCHGPTDRDCILCKDYQYNSQCVGFCPALSYPSAQTCVLLPSANDVVIT